MKRLGRGDVGMIVNRLERQMERAEQHAADQGLGEKNRTLVRDVGVIAGVSLTMLGNTLSALMHVAPGIVCDLTVPLLVRNGRQPGPLLWTIEGGIIGAGRFATIFGITLAVQAPTMAYAMLIPGFTVHTTFGALSGYVSYHLVKAITRLREKISEDDERDRHDKHDEQETAAAKPPAEPVERNAT